jgi:hypothetical protein
MDTMNPHSTRMILSDETTWPHDVVRYLTENHDLFLNWETMEAGRGPTLVCARDYDCAIYGLRDVLSKYTLHGYHCTRLHESEIEHIKLNGMQPPNVKLLHKRIRAIQELGIISQESAQHFIANNQAHESYRADMIWFCFFEPHFANQFGIERFFRSWGGEALYNSHEDDPVTGPILRQIGSPCIVEADIPIENLAIHGGLELKVVRRFLVNHGLQTREPMDHEDRANKPINSQNVKRIILFPEKDFISLTKCDEWLPILS